MVFHVVPALLHGEIKELFCFFQRDGATCDTPNDSVTRFHEALTEERTVNRRLWAPTFSGFDHV